MYMASHVLDENFNSNIINYENGTLTNTILEHMNYSFAGLTVGYFDLHVCV